MWALFKVIVLDALLGAISGGQEFYPISRRNAVEHLTLQLSLRTNSPPNSKPPMKEAAQCSQSRKHNRITRPMVAFS